MPETKRHFYPMGTEEPVAERRSRFSWQERCHIIMLAVVSPLTIISLATYAVVVSFKMTEYGSCPSEFNTVRAGRCAKHWSLSLNGPLVQCDATSKFNVPYWYRDYPLCTTKEVNLLTTLSVVSSILFLSVVLYRAQS
jgi:hypothetical protein